MAAYKSTERRVKDALIQILSGIQYDTGSGPSNAFISVAGDTATQFNGYPSARILPDHLASSTATNIEKDHQVSYMVLIGWPLQDQANVESDMYNSMYDITSLTIDAIEHADRTNQLNTIDSNIKNWIMQITDASWQVMDLKSGYQLVSWINIEMTYSKDVS